MTRLGELARSLESIVGIKSRRTEAKAHITPGRTVLHAQNEDGVIAVKAEGDLSELPPFEMAGFSDMGDGELRATFAHRRRRPSEK